MVLCLRNLSFPLSLKEISCFRIFTIVYLWVSVTGALPGPHYNTLRPKMNEGKQKSQRNWISWQFKLTFCPFSGRVFEIVSLRPTEIWAPWYTNFGNPEIKNMDLSVLDDAYAVSKRNFDFQGCHLFYNIEFLLNYGNPELKITD